jgi:hypothetical protein
MSGSKPTAALRKEQAFAKTLNDAMAANWYSSSEPLSCTGLARTPGHLAKFG